jgi:hypothetical protein
MSIAPSQLTTELRLPQVGKRSRTTKGGSSSSFPRNLPRNAPKYLPKDPASSTRQQGTTVSQAQGWVEVSQHEMNAVYSFYEDCDIIGAALHKLDDSVTSGGAEVRLTEFGHDVTLSDAHTQFVKNEFTQFLRDFQLYKLLFGVVVVRLGESRDYPGEIAPYVVPYTKYKLGFMEGSGLSGRRYYVK